MSSKIETQRTIVNILGDEMTKIIWQHIDDELISPYISIQREVFDLSINERDQAWRDNGPAFRDNGKPIDKLTLAAADAIKKHKVGIKCATITHTPARVNEFGSEQMLPSPNGILRNSLDGTVFREPIIIDTIPRAVRSWTHPICIGRHAHADQYDAVDFDIPKEGTLTLTFTPDDGNDAKHFELKHFNGPGIAMGMYNTDESITKFAHSCFKLGLDKNWPVYLSTKDTILKIYDQRFATIFESVYQEHYQADYKNAGIETNSQSGFEHRLIDDMVAFAIKSSGGYIWACKNYDGDVQSDSIAQGFGSLGLMKSYLLSSDGYFLAEAAHGTVTRHFRIWQQEQEQGSNPNDTKTSTNSIASIFAWTAGIRQTGKLDQNNELVNFANTLEQATIETVNQGKMTKDLALLAKREGHLNTIEFIKAVRTTLESLLTNSSVQLEKSAAS